MSPEYKHICKALSFRGKRLQRGGKVFFTIFAKKQIRTTRGRPHTSECQRGGHETCTLWPPPAPFGYFPARGKYLVRPQADETSHNWGSKQKIFSPASPTSPSILRQPFPPLNTSTTGVDFFACAAPVTNHSACPGEKNPRCTAASGGGWQNNPVTQQTYSVHPLRSDGIEDIIRTLVLYVKGGEQIF